MTERKNETVKENQLVGTNQKDFYDNLNNREEDVKQIANFCNSYLDLINLEDDLKILKELGSLENTTNRLRRRGKVNALKNLYAMAKLASKLSSAHEDFLEYEKEAFEIGKKFNIEKRVNDKFKKLASDYVNNIYGFSDFVTREYDNFVESRDRFNAYKNTALEIAQRYDFDKREILRNLKGGISRL